MANWIMFELREVRKWVWVEGSEEVSLSGKSEEVSLSWKSEEVSLSWKSEEVSLSWKSEEVSLVWVEKVRKWVLSELKEVMKWWCQWCIFSKAYNTPCSFHRTSVNICWSLYGSNLYIQPIFCFIQELKTRLTRMRDRLLRWSQEQEEATWLSILLHSVHAVSNKFVLLITRNVGYDNRSLAADQLMFGLAVWRCRVMFWIMVVSPRNRSWAT